MRWINFPDGSKYTFAVDIQKLAEMNGYRVPAEDDGTRHPGTDCNLKMRAVLKDISMRCSFGITESSVVDVRAEDTPFNGAFLKWLVDNELVNSYYVRKGVIQLYTKEAVDAILSVMLKINVEYKMDDTDDEWNCPILVTKRSHGFEKKKYRPKISLFKK